jgi:hypothetical protein
MRDISKQNSEILDLKKYPQKISDTYNHLLLIYMNLTRQQFLQLIREEIDDTLREEVPAKQDARTTLRMAARAKAIEDNQEHRVNLRLKQVDLQLAAAKKQGWSAKDGLDGLPDSVKKSLQRIAPQAFEAPKAAPPDDKDNSGLLGWGTGFGL